MGTKIEKISNTPQEKKKRVPQKVWDAWGRIIEKLGITHKAIAVGIESSEPTVSRAINKMWATTSTQWAITNFLAQAEAEAEEDEIKQLEALKAS